MKWFRSWLRRVVGAYDRPAPRKRPGFFTTEAGRDRDDNDMRELLGTASSLSLQRTHESFVLKNKQGNVVTMDAAAMDDAGTCWNTPSLKQAFVLNNRFGIPDAQVEWYASQGFIGYQMCAILAQHWLIAKACAMPARDATRNGWEITVNDGTDAPPGVLDYMAKLDKRFHLKHHAREFVRNCRVFGIRIALFEVTSEDPEYYTKPFNPDGVTAGSYKGISQVDPYWITPELDFDASANPASQHFYEPTYWRVNGKRYHRSHLVIIRNGEVPDVLKPTYFFGGIPLPQMIYERVYAAERTANEAPQLALTKRSTLIHVDLAAAAANQANLEARMTQWAYYRDNYGIKVLGEQETAEQFDTALNDFDMLIMTQYQLVAAIAETPATKILGTTPKGFNATGEYEEANYHEMLESVQEHDILPLLERHHLLCMRSHVAPKFGVAPFETFISFNELDPETAKEKSERQFQDSQRDKNYSDTGALDGIDVRKRLIEDKDSGYNGIEAAIPEGPRPISIIDPGAEKTAPNAPLPAEQVAPGGNGAATTH
jgi:phage-related protein (TIGR01555 family)